MIHPLRQLSATANVSQTVNRLLRRHTKSAYSSIAIRHIAEQIDKLYWEAGAPDLHADEALSQTGITPDDDLTSDEYVFLSASATDPRLVL